MLLLAGVNGGHRPSDLADHDGLATSFGLVVEADPVAREQAVGLSAVHRGVDGEHLGAGLRAAGVKRRSLALRRRSRVEHLRRRSLVEAGVDAGGADRIKQADRAVPVTSEVYSGSSKETCTWLWAPRW